MTRLRIEAFAWDDENEEKLARRFDPDEVDSLLESPFIVLRNKRGRAGSHRLVGRSYTGSVITVVIVAARARGTWRPITAWPADPEELAHARQQGIIQ